MTFLVDKTNNNNMYYIFTMFYTTLISVVNCGFQIFFLYIFISFLVKYIKTIPNIH
jgi:hypothetical protein